MRSRRFSRKNAERRRARGRRQPSVLHLDLVYRVLGDGWHIALGFPAIQVPATLPDPRLEKTQILLALFLGGTQALVHVARLAPSVFPIVEPAHQGARVGPADVEDQIRIRVHSRPLEVGLELRLVLYEVAQIGRLRPMTGATSLLEQRRDI